MEAPILPTGKVGRPDTLARRAGQTRMEEWEGPWYCQTKGKEQSVCVCARATHVRTHPNTQAYLPTLCVYTGKHARAHTHTHTHTAM